MPARPRLLLIRRRRSPDRHRLTLETPRGGDRALEDRVLDRLALQVGQGFHRDRLVRGERRFLHLEQRLRVVDDRPGRHVLLGPGELERLVAVGGEAVTHAAIPLEPVERLQRHLGVVVVRPQD